AFAGTRDSRASAHVELAGVDHVAVLRHLDAVAAGRPAVGVADVEVGGLRTGGNVLGFFGDRLVAVQVGPLRDQAARRGAVGGDRCVDGVAAGERGQRRGDLVVGADRIAQGDRAG